MNRYAVEYNVHTEDNKHSFKPLVFKSTDAIDDCEFDMIVNHQKDKVVETFTTYGIHVNYDKSETEVIYTRGYIETDMNESQILKTLIEKSHRSNVMIDYLEKQLERLITYTSSEGFFRGVVTFALFVVLFNVIRTCFTG